MEIRWKLDIARCAAAGLVAAVLSGAAAGADDAIQRALELAGSGRWEDARAVLAAGQRLAPRDQRFPLELAGIEYRRKNFGAAKRYLHQALAIDPAGVYGNDFLATLYFLEGNPEAALKYWNRIGKPRIDQVSVQPEPPVDRVLLDRALAFSPAGVVTLDQYRDTRAWLDALDVFTSYRLDMQAQPEEHFAAVLHWLDPAPWVKAASMLRGIAFQTVEPEWRDMAGVGLNWTSLLRWDAQKRRLATALEGPLRRDPRWRFRAYADARRETWNTGAATDFRLRKTAVGAQLRAVPNWRLSWHTGLEISTRDLAGLPGFSGGTALKYRAGIDYTLLQIPERRFALTSGLTWDAARTFSGARDLYALAQASLAARWLPRAHGSDYEMNARIRGGKTFGDSPFDELFQIGIERDNDLWLRGHAGTLGGKKGSAPIGRDYVLTNWEMYKDLYRNPLFTLQAGPFVDAAHVRDVFRRFESTPWLLDSGVQLRTRLPGGLSVTATYGRALRDGGKAIYATVGR